jgi:hypothetical protein
MRHDVAASEDPSNQVGQAGAAARIIGKSNDSMQEDTFMCFGLTTVD